MKKSAAVNALQSGKSLRNLSFCLAAMVAFATLTGCAHRLIPGTEIEDTDDNHKIIGVIEKYRVAMQDRNPEAVLALVDESFRDDGGTGTPADDLDYKQLQAVLPQRLSKITDLRLDLTIKKITMNDEETEAHAIYYFTTTFRIPSLSQKTQTESGLKMMDLKKVKDGWKITSGI